MMKKSLFVISIIVVLAITLGGCATKRDLAKVQSQEMLTSAKADQAVARFAGCQGLGRCSHPQGRGCRSPCRRCCEEGGGKGEDRRGKGENRRGKDSDRRGEGEEG